MAESIVKVPQCAADDMDFLAFSFNGKHSWDDFGIYRTIDGDRYSENFAPTLNDKTAEVPGGDGMYYFGTTHKQRDFNISFAFDHLTEAKLREMKKWLNGKEMGDLWFSEAPYKVWTAKPSGNSAIKYIPFDGEDGQRVYKGEGTIQFTAYWPYAHTPDFVATYYDIIINNSPEYYELKNSLLLNKNSKIWVWEEDIGYVTNCGLEYGDVNGNYSSFSFNKDYYVFNDHDNITITQLGFTRPLSCQIYTGELGNLTPIELKNLTPIAKNSNGLLLSSYNQFGNKNQWAGVSGLTDTFTLGDNNGDLPAPFILKQDGYIPAGTKFTVDKAEITTTSDCYNLEWDSKTGLVIAGDTIDVTDYKQKKPIDVIGDTCAAIPVGGVDEIKGFVSIIDGAEVDSEVSYYFQLSNSYKRAYDGVTESIQKIPNLSINYHYWYY